MFRSHKACRQGRSAYEPPEQPFTPPLPPVVPRPSQDEGSPEGQNEEGPYVQLYDDRGHPINPLSRALARSLRDAQNDVLAAVGVVERKTPIVPSDWSRTEVDTAMHAEVQNEDLYGSLVGIGALLTKHVCTWWVGSLRDRLLVFAAPATASFAELMASEYRHSGFYSFFFEGLPCHVVSLITNDGAVWAPLIIQYLDTLVLRYRISRKKRKWIQRLKPFILNFLIASIEVAFFPLILHTTLQRLHLVPTAQVFPPLRSFVPFSRTSPIQLIPLPRDLGIQSIGVWVGQWLRSPIVVLCAWRSVLNWLQVIIYESLEAELLKPDNPDQYTIYSVMDRRSTEWIAGRQGKKARSRLLSRALRYLGWSFSDYPSPPSASPSNEHADLTGNRPANQDQPATENEALGSVDIEDTPRPAAVQEATGNDETEVREADNENGAPGRPSPTSSTAGDEDQTYNRDATVRIASRDAVSGTVSLEIAFPEDGLPSPEALGAGLVDSGQADGGESLRRRTRISRPFHRVTQLSEEPANLIASLVCGSLSSLVLLPLKAAVLHQITLGRFDFIGQWPDRRCLLGRHSQGSVSLIGGWSKLGLSGFDWRVTTSFAGKIALCSAMELALGFGLWGVEYFLVTRVGRRHFKWGKL